MIPIAVRFLRTPLLQANTPPSSPATNTTTPTMNNPRTAIEIPAPTIEKTIEAVDQSNPCRLAGRSGATPETMGGHPGAPTYPPTQ